MIDPGERTIKDIEFDLRELLSEYCDACREKRQISFQGAVSEMAWEIEHKTDDITEDVC